MFKTRNQELVLFTRTPTSQRADRSNKPNVVEDHQSSTRGAKGAWLEELPNVLWAYRTITRTPTRETPFRLTYGTEVVIPVEVGITSMRRKFFQEGSNDNQLKVNLDCLDEMREEAY